MIELLHSRLEFSFMEVHRDARFALEFQRTLRLPDDNRDHPLPPGLGRFPVDHVDDYAEKLPESWKKRGGVFFPMYQSEAMWINFTGQYPFAVKIAAGKINAVTGEPWKETLGSSPQDYVIVSSQPWLDGFCVTKGMIRQFVAMPLGAGFTAEEQLTGDAQHGGLQIIAYPMKAERYERLLADRREKQRKSSLEFSWACDSLPLKMRMPDFDMGLAPGGLMRQHIYEDAYGIDAWDTSHRSRCFVHILNSMQYLEATGRNPPTKAPTAKDYASAGLPWFEYYSDAPALGGSSALAGLTSVAANWVGKNNVPMPDNDPVGATKTVALGPSGKSIVREGEI
jgi:hypothetical protein